MIKTAFAAAAALAFAPAAALAGPYVNVETNAGWTGSEYNGAATDCLLYTSPSPRDQRGSRMPSSA